MYLKKPPERAFGNRTGGLSACADEGTRTPTSLRHKILSLARLPITTHPRKNPRKSIENNYYYKVRGLTAKFKVLSEIYFSYMFIFSKLRRCARHQDTSFEQKVGTVGYCKGFVNVMIGDDYPDIFAFKA